MFWPGLRYSSVYAYQLGNYPTEEERERELAASFADPENSV